MWSNGRAPRWTVAGQPRLPGTSSINTIVSKRPGTPRSGSVPIAVLCSTRHTGTITAPAACECA
jgi:hypothetical protein